MHEFSLDNGPLALAFAMLTGVIGQGLGRHTRIPSIVLLLVAGVALGPDVANVIRPHAMGAALSAVVGFAVAIILFEGGLSLQLSVLRSQARPIRRLVSIGAIVTAALAAVTARVVMPWDWRLSILFGTLVIVTGPTVVTPLLRRLRVSAKLTSILIAEGILIDAVGATIAVVALEIALAPSRGAVAAGAFSIFARFGVGAGVGLAGGLVLVALLRVHRLVPHGLENVLVLATVVATFQASHAIVSESGITAAIVAGLIVGNFGSRLHRKIADFNEQLTLLFVATLFVLLAADVRLADVAALGWNGVIVVAVLMVLVRPATVFASTTGTELNLAEKLYLSWIAPRGIVAAAVASLFAFELAHVGIPGGVEMRALVFTLIAATVTIHGLTAAPVAQLLGVRRPARSGYLVLGANALSRLLASALTQFGERVMFVESNPENCRISRAAGFDTIEADGLQPEVLAGAGIDGIMHAVALTPNEHVNLLFAQTIAEELRGPELHIALERFEEGITPAMAERHDASVLFAVEHDLLLWIDRARRGQLTTQRWKLAAGREDAAFTEMPTESVLRLLHVRGGSPAPFTHRSIVRGGDEIVIAVAAGSDDNVATWLAGRGWTRMDVG